MAHPLPRTPPRAAPSGPARLAVCEYGGFAELPGGATVLFDAAAETSFCLTRAWFKRFFAEITRKRIRRGAFKSLAELEQAIYDYLAKHNQNPVPLVWIVTAMASVLSTSGAYKASHRHYFETGSEPAKALEHKPGEVLDIDSTAKTHSQVPAKKQT